MARSFQSIRQSIAKFCAMAMRVAGWRSFCQTLPPSAALSPCWCPPDSGMPPGLLDELRRISQPDEQRHDDDEDDATDPFGRHELPSHEDKQDEAKLDHEVCGGELEGEAWNERRALLEESAADCGGSVGAA